APDETQRTSGFTPAEVVEELVLQLPENAIVSVEGSSCGAPYLRRAHRARRHWVMTNTGGAIGQGIPCGVGAAIARPDSRVICLQSDGSAQYTIQALWTMAREALGVTLIICANHRYGILQTELRRAGVSLEGRASAHLTRLDAPRVDWVSLARAYGVPGAQAQTQEEFRYSLRQSLQARGPMLIECQLP
ncbi:MAG TPA: thiamine pyrophosphate-dependent enzyme, partial [Steroidobacteraceae bacterium]|nr:thiamine pyrophosphate-dependent enzyme [Steroidobacteraceae bacterium]